MTNSSDDAKVARAAESHHVTFFAPDRPVDGTTVYAVDPGGEASDPGGEDGSPAR